MLGTVARAWKVEELRKKLLFTVLIVIIFRFGSAIPVPFLNIDALKGLMGNLNEGGAILAYLDTLSGGAFAQATLFAMSISPYINASIIMQLMTVALPILESLQKEGEEGRKKLTAITRYVTIVLGLIQGTAYYLLLRNGNYQGQSIVKYIHGNEGVFAAIIIVMVFTAGTALMMWLGEQVNEKGVGNGISILLFAGIVSRLPGLITKMISFIMLAISDSTQYGKYFAFVPLYLLVFLGMMWLIVYMNDAERRIPVQYAKRTVGRKVYAGQNSHIPLKVGLAGVMPVIFASSILQIPSWINFFAKPTGIMKSILNAISIGGWMHSLLQFLLIVAFSYFYVAITYNPIEMSNNLRQSNGVIPGIRPGKPTVMFFSKVLSKVTLVGAMLLAFIALFPMIFGYFTGMMDQFFQGTSIIILVGVALETIKQLESQMMLRHYKGFLD